MAYQKTNIGGEAHIIDSDSLRSVSVTIQFRISIITIQFSGTQELCDIFQKKMLAHEMITDKSLLEIAPFMEGGYITELSIQ